MKYFRLMHNGLNVKETGTQFQSLKGPIGDIQKDFIPFEGRIDFDFALPEPHLEKKAKQTTYLNVMMIPSWFLVLEKNFIQFLENFNIEEYQTWDLNIHHNGKTINDYQLFILLNAKQSEYIDFSKSEVYAGKISDPYYEESLKILDYQDYLVKREFLMRHQLTIKHKKIVLNLHSVALDLFRIINAPCSGYYVSQKLKVAIEKQEFTGFAFKEIESMENKVEIIY